MSSSTPPPPAPLKSVSLANLRKLKLANSLTIAVNALQNNIVKYNWDDQQSCNCGIVSQVLLDKSSTELCVMFDQQNLFDEKQTDRSWTGAVQAFCPITKNPMKKIFVDLDNAGLSKEDITHLEYLNNKEILKKSGIKKGWFDRKHNYKSKENLIKYLKSWIVILHQEIGTICSTDLNIRLQFALDKEDYVEAALIRDVLQLKN